ncbi:SaV-like [uncultured Caudovirales phage]|uniref:SaV-like n=1 Tax=uncultured Caudovirales phage TaxID=2100421 RepID=A0A6J5NPC1_9CAUD|nr:SaV-like [uncultured Caudovirales phage]
MIAASSEQYPAHDPYLPFVSGPALTPAKDNIFRPKHYAQFWPEPITVVNSWGLNFNRGNAIKYIARAGHKNDEAEDLRKAIRYLEIELECINRRRRVADGEPPILVWSDTL